MIILGVAAWKMVLGVAFNVLVAMVVFGLGF